MGKHKKVIKRPTIKTKTIPPDRHGRKILGWAYPSENLIEIEKNQPDKEFLNTLLHEMLHVFFPSLSEERVTRTADLMADIVWRRNYRSHRIK